MPPHHINSDDIELQAQDHSLDSELSGGVDAVFRSVFTGTVTPG